jgi:DNA-binding transcriptional ArsR family regulator
MPKSKEKSKGLRAVGTIVAHPLRARCWTALTERTSSPVELSRIFHEDLSNVSYHVKVLEELGVVELVDTRDVRGSVEHYYRAIERPISDTADTASRSLENRTGFALHICQALFADASQALDAGSFCERDDHQVVRIPMNLDDAGFGEASQAFEDLYEKLYKAQAESSKRMGPEDPGINVTAAGMLFERSPGLPNSSG